MKRLDHVPEQVLEKIKTDHERAVECILEKYQLYESLPVRPVRMRMFRSSTGTDFLAQTIVPATSIYLSKHAFFDEEHIDRNAITYTVSGTKKPFPYGHIYAASGHVCLGSIFVPSKISRYSPQQPLETLFLHNDRNLGHGNAKLFLTEAQLKKIAECLEDNGVQMSKDAGDSLRPCHNVLQDDGIWLLGADVYSQKEDLQEAVRIMETVYSIIFHGQAK